MTKKNMRQGDEASRFKQQSFNAIKRNRILKKFRFYLMVFIAAAMIIAVLVSSIV